MRKHYKQQWHIVSKMLLLAFLPFVSFIGNAQTKQPVPYATVAGQESGSKISIATLKENTALTVSAKEASSQKYYVISYKMVLDRRGGDPVSATCQSAAFSTQAKQYLERYLEHGRVISFEDIRVRDENGKEVKIPSIFYIID